MDYLIDTHTLLWIVTDSPKLSNRAKKLYLSPENKIFISLFALLFRGIVKMI